MDACDTECEGGGRPLVTRGFACSDLPTCTTMCRAAMPNVPWTLRLCLASTKDQESKPATVVEHRHTPQSQSDRHLVPNTAQTNLRSRDNVTREVRWLGNAESATCR